MPRRKQLSVSQIIQRLPLEKAKPHLRRLAFISRKMLELVLFDSFEEDAEKVIELWNNWSAAMEQDLPQKPTTGKSKCRTRTGKSQIKTKKHKPKSY